MYLSPLYAMAPCAFPRVPKPHQRVRASHGQHEQPADPAPKGCPSPSPWRHIYYPYPKRTQAISVPALAPVSSFWVTRWDRPMTNNHPSILSPHTSQGLSLGSRKLSGNLGTGQGASGTKMLKNQRQNRKVWEQQDRGRRRCLSMSPIPLCH